MHHNIQTYYNKQQNFGEMSTISVITDNIKALDRFLGSYGTMKLTKLPDLNACDRAQWHQITKICIVSK